MIRITIEIIPFGNELDKHTIGKLHIHNRGDHPEPPYLANYAYLLDINKRLYDGTVENHTRADGILKLLALVFKRWA